MTKDLTPAEALVTLRRAKAGAKAAYWQHFPARAAVEHFGKFCGSNPVCRVHVKDAAKGSGY
eukprot:358277-Chlamydomonas_euryale.AAC.10